MLREFRPMRPRLRPTLTGACCLLAVLALLATAINYGNNLVFFLAFLLLSLWLQGAWSCWRNLAGLGWQPAPGLAGFAGSRLELGGHPLPGSGRSHRQLRLAQGRGRLGRPLFLGPALDLNETASPEHQTGRLGLSLPCPPRGRRQIDALQLCSTYPLGFWQARLPLPPLQVWAYPQPEAGAALPGESPNPAHRHQEADDFQGLRPYAPGDSPRRINWRVFSRREELAVNSFDGGRGGQTLWLDLARSSGDLEARLSRLAGQVLEAEHQGREYGLRLGARSCPPGRGPRQRQRCLEALAGYGAEQP